MALNITDFKAWKSNEIFKKDEHFQHMGLVYRVLSQYSATEFNPRDSRITLTTIGQGSPDDSRGIEDVYIDENGHLIFEFTDGQTKDVGKVVQEQTADRIVLEALTVNNSGVLSATSNSVDTNYPCKLYINGVVYFSIGSDPDFSVSGTTVTWNDDFSLTAIDKILIEYTREEN